MANSSASFRCPRCRPQQKKSTKNIVVCIDGNANNTNVSKLFTNIDLELTSPEQYAYYSGGVGAHPKSKKAVLRDTADIAIARNLKENVKNAYRWLAEKYREGDQIYLFGFSRGAYQVRMLAAMIHEVGLTKEPTENHVDRAYEHYKSSRSGGQKARQTARGFKKSFCWQGMRVHFVGVWDTVSSVGFLPQDISLSRSSSAEHACHFRHALALDELRVKFLPEYLSGVSVDRKGSDIKEVWFAGSHSDVGGKNSTGRYHQPGNVSLIWMRREASASGLVLKPTDIVWLPHDLDVGITNSMANAWRAAEYVPVRHQVSARRFQRQQPRRIIPGQKIHASILYAHAYEPKATLGKGFDISITLPGFEDAKLDGGIWETGLFDASAAEGVVACLSGSQGVAPIYLDRLLFMLRFREGRQSVRNIPGWEEMFEQLMVDYKGATIIRLVAIVAYHEASSDPEACPNNRMPLSTGLSEDILLDAKSCLQDVISHHKHRDGPRIVALLRLLTKHQILRERILTEDILETLVDSFDEVIAAASRHFVLAMDGLNCLLQCVDIRLRIVAKLRSGPQGDAMSRLSRILEVKDPLDLFAALRMVSILVRIPEGRDACSIIESKIKQLASKNERLIGPLAAQLYLALYNPNHKSQLDIRNAHARTNLASALLCLACQADFDEVFDIFGLGATELTARHRSLISELKTTVEEGKNVRERTAATITLLKLCGSTIIRDHYREIKLLDTFVGQLQRKDSALLAALALVTCLKYPDLEYIKDDKRLPQYIITMFKQNYFDNAVGQFEGFQVFRELMQHDDLREKIISGDVMKILTDKLEMGTNKATRSALMHLDTFRSSEPQYPWTEELCDTGLEHLKVPAWTVQKAGVNIFSALAQTEYGVEAINVRVPEIVEMLLPDGYSLIRPRTQGKLTNSGIRETRKKYTDSSTPRSPSWMMGPAYALRILAQNPILRDCISKTIQYSYVKDLHQSGALVAKNDAAAWRWRLKTPNRAQVIQELDAMIDAVDDDSGPIWSWIGDAVPPPRIHYWHRLVMPIDVSVRSQEPCKHLCKTLDGKAPLGERQPRVRRSGE